MIQPWYILLCTRSHRHSSLTLTIFINPQIYDGETRRWACLPITRISLNFISHLHHWDWPGPATRTSPAPHSPGCLHLGWLLWWTCWSFVSLTERIYQSSCCWSNLNRRVKCTNKTFSVTCRLGVIIKLKCLHLTQRINGTFIRPLSVLTNRKECSDNSLEIVPISDFIKKTWQFYKGWI